MTEARENDTWDDLYRLWAQARETSRVEADGWTAAARRRIARNTPDDWRWLAEALADPGRKWFVAGVFTHAPVPKRMFGPMLRAGVLEPNPSANRWFIEPCVASLGGRRVLEGLLRYLESGNDAEKAGAVSALYWAGGNPRNEALDALRERIRCEMLQEFVANPDLNLRQQILSMLRLEPEAYPEALRPLVPAAIEIARSHADAYLRHRVEVQLGASSPLMPIPPARPDPSEA